MNQVMENWGNPRATKEQKFLILMNSSLPGFPFIFHSFSVLKNFDNSKMQTLFCTFSPRVHIVLGFTFRFMIHFRLIFIYGMGWELMFIFFPYDYPVDQTPFIKKIFLFLFSVFSPLSNQLTLNIWVYFWTLYSVPLIICLPLCGYKLFWLL